MNEGYHNNSIVSENDYKIPPPLHQNWGRGAYINITATLRNKKTLIIHIKLYMNYEGYHNNSIVSKNDYKIPPPIQIGGGVHRTTTLRNKKPS